MHGMDALEGDLSTSESHVVKTTCDLNKSQSPFGGCVITPWCLCGFSRPTMQGMESVVAVLIPDTSFRLKCWDMVSMTSLHWQTSLQTQTGHA